MPSVRVKKHICPEEGCDKAYNRPSLLRQHQRTHSNERPFACPNDNCDSAFFRKSHLETHLLSHLQNEDKPYQCPVCGKGLTSIQRLRRHEATHTKSFKCTFEGCDKAFYAWQSLKHHERMDHEKSLTCDHCNRCFPNKPSLNKHKLKHHGEVSPFLCVHPGCFHTFKNERTLKNHMETVHPNLTCGICHKVCIGNKALATHMLTHTTNERNTPLFHCELCDTISQFVSKEDLFKHYEEFHGDHIPSNLKDPENHFASFLLKKAHSAKSMETMLRNADLKPESMESIHVMNESDEDTNKNTSSVASKKRKITLPDDLMLSPERRSIVSLVMNLNQKVYTCPRGNCQRKYVRQHAFRKHIQRHNMEAQKADQILRRLEEEENSISRVVAAQKTHNEKQSQSVDHFSDISDTDYSEE